MQHPSELAYEIELPLPPRAASPNYRGHTKARASAIRQYRQDCYFLLRAARVPALEPPVRVSYTFYLAKPETTAERYNLANLYFPLDDDDAIGAMKAARDALADAGVVPCDSRSFVRQGGVEWRTTKDVHEGRRCVVMRLEGGV
jgi:hypothetical protein